MPLLARPFDQPVEDFIREAALVRLRVGLQEQPEVVLRIRIPRQPPRHRDVGGTVAGQADLADQLGLEPKDFLPAACERLRDSDVARRGGEHQPGLRARALEVRTGELRVEAGHDLGRVALKGRRNESARGGDVVGRQCRRDRRAVDRMRERTPEIRVSEAGVVEAEVHGRGDRAQAHLVLCSERPVRPHGIAVDDRIELAALVRREVLADLQPGHRDGVRIAAPAAGVVVAPHEDELSFVEPLDPERPAHDLALGRRPIVAVELDRVARHRASVGPVQDAQEVRRRRRQPELDRQVVEGADPDPVQVVVALEVVVLRLFEHEVDRHRRARSLRVEQPLDPVLDVVCGQGCPIRPRRSLAEVEDVVQAVVGDLPALGERGHDRALGPGLHETVEHLHAELDVGPRDRPRRIDELGEGGRRRPEGSSAGAAKAPAASSARRPGRRPRSTRRSAWRCGGRSRA